MLVTYWILLSVLSSLFARCGHPETSFAEEMRAVFLSSGEAVRTVMQTMVLGGTVSQYRQSLLSEAQAIATTTFQDLLQEYANRLWESIHDNAVTPAASTLHEVQTTAIRYYHTSVVVPVTVDPNQSNSMSLGMSGLYLPYDSTAGYLIRPSPLLLLAFAITFVSGVLFILLCQRLLAPKTQNGFDPAVISPSNTGISVRSEARQTRQAPLDARSTPRSAQNAVPSAARSERESQAAHDAGESDRMEENANNLRSADSGTVYGASLGVPVRRDDVSDTPHQQHAIELPVSASSSRPAAVDALTTPQPARPDTLAPGSDRGTPAGDTPSRPQPYINPRRRRIDRSPSWRAPTNPIVIGTNSIPHTNQDTSIIAAQPPVPSMDQNGLAARTAASVVQNPPTFENPPATQIPPAAQILPAIQMAPAVQNPPTVQNPPAVVPVPAFRRMNTGGPQGVGSSAMFNG